MKKVISFSLWGDNPTYNVGAIKNAEQALTIYPGFECWFYIHTDSVPHDTINKLKNMPNTRIFLKTGDINKIKPMMWRFEAIDEPEVEIMLSRDTDTRFLIREKLAVDEWLSSNNLFHIMRDHPHHVFCILGGMFGTRKIPQIPKWSDIMNTINQVGERDYDQTFLQHYIYPTIKNFSTIHATFHKKESTAKNFPIKYCEHFKFVGEYIYSDESRSQEHVNILKQHV